MRADESDGKDMQQNRFTEPSASLVVTTVLHFVTFSKFYLTHMLIGECAAYNHVFLETDKSTVPLSIEVGQNTTFKSIHSVVTLSCLAMSYPRASVYWYKEAKPLTPRDNQLIVKSATISHVRVLGTVTINSLKRTDNGTYSCEAINDHEASMATQDVVVLEPAEISVDSVEPLDPRTAFLRWSIQYKGNLPIKRYHLQMKNYSTGTDWLDMDDKIPPNATSYTVRYLAPAVTYGFQLAAVNEAGHSAWEAKNVTMPPDVPPKVSWVQMMASTNETLLFGWRKPPHDNGSNITHYVVQLNKEGDLVSNETLPVTPSERQNYIFVFVGLEPGECYAFQVQACSIVGCGSRSHPLDAITSDGMADPPESVEIRCFHDDKQNLNYVVVTWEQPKNARGTVQAYNITLEGEVRFRNVTGEVVEDRFKEFNAVKKESLVFKSTVKPNTNYTVRVCTVNKAGCGPQSKPSDKTFCLTPPTIPSSMPEFDLDQMDGREKCTQLKLKLKRISERNGFIRCYRIIVIKLARGDNLSILPNESHILNITSYDETHEEGNPRGAYLAETFASEDFMNEVVLGDGQFSICDLSAAQPGVFDGNFHVRRSLDPDEEDLDNVYDGPLNPDTNYTGYVEVHVWGQDGEILSKQSPYFKPVQTSKCSLSTSGSSSGAAPPSNVRPDSPVNFLFAVICGTVLVVLVLILVICLIRRRNSCPYDEDGEHLGLTDLIRRTVHRNNHLPRGSHLAKLPYLGPIAAEELPAAYVEKHLDTDILFKTEFEALPEVFRDRTTIASDSTENVIKNRYPGLKAYDQTRIRLIAIPDNPGSDYINANFIEGYRERKLYICTQAPLNCTIADFWRMVWEHGASVVVMLTGLEENGEEKCCQYWSDGKPLELNRYFSVSLKNFKRCSDYILRTLSLKLVKGGEVEQREVLHFHFLMWSDFLTPGQPSWLLRFIKRVNEHYTSQRGPLVVHCSSGVGRTGTYVAIDNLTQQLDEEGIVDIFAFVSNLRYHRNFLVQTLEEYIFVYRALMEHAQFGDTELELHHLRDHYELLKGKVRENCRTGLEIEFEKLNDVFEEPKTYCVGAWEINRSKNRYECIIPYDINRVILLPSVTGQSSYINASHVQGYYRSLSFIITQDPLTHTIWDFWRMVKEQNITTLVMLSDVGEDLNKCPQYWPDEDKEELYDTVRVKLKSSNKSVHYIVRQFVVTDNEDENKHLLTQFQILNWSSSSAGVPDNVSSLITAIEDVQQHQNNQPTSGPITVHCSGGGDRSGIYLALTDLIQQAKSDERVDVFQTTKYARAQRHCLLQTIEQYDFLYRGIIQYVERYNLCNMGDTPL